MSTFVVFGDAHFGAGADYCQPGVRLQDQTAALDQVVDVAIDCIADAVLFAGDAFEGPLVTPEQYDAFRRPLRRLAERGIPVVGISGNGRHDAAMRSVNALEVMSEVLDVHREPGVVKLGRTYVALLPWASTARLVAAHNGGDRDATNSEAGELLIEIARGLYARIPAGEPSLLLGHWSLAGAHLPNGLPVDDLREPVIETGELEAIGFDLCVFGHIHVPGPVSDKTFYTGPLATTSFGEAGVEHGCWRIDLHPEQPGRLLHEISFVPLEERPFVTIDADLTTGAHEQLGLGETDAIAAAIAPHLPLDEAVVRVRYRATEEQARRINWPKLRELLDDCHKIYDIQADIVRADRARVEALNDAEISPLEAVDLWLEAEEITGPKADALRDLTAAYLQELGS